MAKRHSMSRRGSKSYFSATAAKTNAKNLPRGMPMRGGIRL